MRVNVVSRSLGKLVAHGSKACENVLLVSYRPLALERIFTFAKLHSVPRYSNYAAEALCDSASRAASTAAIAGLTQSYQPLLHTHAAH